MNIKQLNEELKKYINGYEDEVVELLYEVFEVMKDFIKYSKEEPLLDNKKQIYGYRLLDENGKIIISASMNWTRNIKDGIQIDITPLKISDDNTHQGVTYWVHSKEEAEKELQKNKEESNLSFWL
jgi:hypothetical protein